MKKSQQVIWQVLDSRNMGGIESHVLELSHGLKNTGWQVKVLFLNDYGPHPLKDKLRNKGITYLCLDGKATSYFKLLSQQKPSILHTHGYKAGIMGRLFCKTLGIPVVSTFHAGEKTTGKLALYSFLDRMTAFLSSPLAVSQKIAKKLPCNTKCLNNFVSIPVEPHENHGKTIAFVGRLSHEKGPDLFCKISSKHPDLTFKVFGDGPMRQALEDEYAHRIEFLGQVDMGNHWHEIDLLCMPSRFEGLPMAALEAMAHGIPVLASDAGAFPKLIDHNKTGWIVPIEQADQYNTIIHNWFLQDGKSKDKFGQKARQIVKAQYSPEVIIPQIEEVYLCAAGG